MIIYQNEKYSCLPCIRGHRSSACNHSNRTLIRVRSRGRPSANDKRVAIQPKNNEIITLTEPPNIASSSSSKVEKGSKSGGCLCGPMKTSNLGKQKDSTESKISILAPDGGGATTFKPIKRCGCGCKPKPKGGVITIKGVVDQKYVEVGKNGARFLSDEDLIEARRNRVFNFISENPGQESRTPMSVPSTPFVEKKSEPNVRCCGKEDCFCENCDFCGGNNMGSLLSDLSSSSGFLSFNNEIQAKASRSQLSNSDFAISDSAMPILSFNKDGVNLDQQQSLFDLNFPPEVQPTKRTSSVSDSQFINTSIHDYGADSGESQPLEEPKGSCCGGANKPPKPASSQSSCCSGGSVAPVARSSCCSGGSAAPVARSSCCSSNSAASSLQSSVLSDVKYVPPPKVSMPTGSCCSAKNVDKSQSTSFHNPSLSLQMGSEFAGNTDATQMAKDMSNMSCSEFDPSQNIHSGIGSVQDSISAGLIAPSNDPLRPPNFILPMGSTLDDVLLTILNNNNGTEKAELPDLVSYLEHERDNLNEFIPSPPMEMTVASSCVLPGQCKCDENCRCPGCSTHHNPPQNLKFLGAHSSSENVGGSSSASDYLPISEVTKSELNKTKEVAQLFNCDPNLEQNRGLSYFGDTQFDISKEGLGSYVSSEQLTQQGSGSNSGECIGPGSSFSGAFDISMLSSSSLMTPNIPEGSFEKGPSEPVGSLFGDISRSLNNFGNILNPVDDSMNGTRRTSSTQVCIDLKTPAEQSNRMDSSYSRLSENKRLLQNSISGQPSVNPLYSGAAPLLNNNNNDDNGASKRYSSCCSGNHKKSIAPVEPAALGFNESFVSTDKSGFMVPSFNMDSLDSHRKEFEGDKALSPSSVTSPPITAYGS